MIGIHNQVINAPWRICSLIQTLGIFGFIEYDAFLNLHISHIFLKEYSIMREKNKGALNNFSEDIAL